MEVPEVMSELRCELEEIDQEIPSLERTNFGTSEATELSVIETRRELDGGS
jgi:hypothetical protein